MKARTIVAAVLVAAAALGGLAACSSSPGGTSPSGSANAPKKIRIAIANLTEQSPIYHSIHQNLDALNTADSGVEIDWYDNESDPTKTLSNVNLMIQSQPDAMVIFPVSETTGGLTPLLEQAGIPCVSVSIATPPCTFMNISNQDLGVGTAKLIATEMQSRGWTESNTTVLLGDAVGAGDPVNNCVKYFYSTLADSLGWASVDPANIKENTSVVGSNGFQFNSQALTDPSFQAVSSLAASIPKGNNIVLYTVSNDSNNGALRALQQAGFDQSKILVGGLAGDAYGLQQLATNPSWVAEGDIFIGYWGEYVVAAAEALIDGAKPTADVVPFPQIVLTKDDLKTYHPDGTTTVAKLPALVPDNQYLGDTAFMKFLDNVAD